MSRYPYRKPRVSVAAEHLPLVLVGLPGAGKTTVARLLATWGCRSLTPTPRSGAGRA